MLKVWYDVKMSDDTVVWSAERRPDPIAAATKAADPVLIAQRAVANAFEVPKIIPEIDTTVQIAPRPQSSNEFGSTHPNFSFTNMHRPKGVSHTPLVAAQAAIHNS